MNDFSIKSSKGYDAPRWYLWDGGFLALGRSDGVIRAHAHHAIQIVISIDGAAGICGSDGEWRSARGIVVRPNVEHAYNGQGSMGAMLLMDPESTEGSWLRASLKQEVSILPDVALVSCVAELKKFCEHPFDSMEVPTLIRHCVKSLCPGAADPPLRFQSDDSLEQDSRVGRPADVGGGVRSDRSLIAEPIRTPVQAASWPAVPALHALAQAHPGHARHRA